MSAIRSLGVAATRLGATLYHLLTSKLPRSRFQPLREAHTGCDPSDDLKLVLAPGPWRLASAYPLPDRDVEERAEDASLAPSTEVVARWNTTAIVAARSCEAPSSTALSRPP